MLSHAASAPLVKGCCLLSEIYRIACILRALTLRVCSYIKSCKSENSVCLVGGLQDHHDLTYVGKNKGFPHQEVCNS